jgi:hypothetical protein
MLNRKISLASDQTEYQLWSSQPRKAIVQNSKEVQSSMALSISNLQILTNKINPIKTWKSMSKANLIVPLRNQMKKDKKTKR